MGIPSYADPDLHRTLDSAIRSSSGNHFLRISVCEQVTRYAEAYGIDRLLPGHVSLHVALVDDTLIGLGRARSIAEERYAGEDLQVQIDAHTRFDGDWDVQVVEQLARLGSNAIVAGGMHEVP